MATEAGSTTAVQDAISLVASRDLRKAGANQIVRVTPKHDGTIQVEVKDEPTLTFTPRKAALINRAFAEYHGWKARLMERSAVEADVKSGKTSARAKWEKLKATIDHYESGVDVWELTVASVAESKGPNLGLLMRAMVAVGKFVVGDDEDGGVDRFNARLAAQAEKHGIDRELVIKRLWDSGEISVKVAELRAQDRASSLASSDALLDGWGDE